MSYSLKYRLQDVWYWVKWNVTFQPRCTCCKQRSPSVEWWGDWFACAPCKFGGHPTCGCSCPGCNPAAYGRISAKHSCKEQR